MSTPYLRTSPGIRTARHLLLIAASAFAVFPIIFLLLNTFKTLPEFFENPYGFPIDWKFENYVQAWTEANVSRGLTNTVTATVAGLAVNFMVAIPASYVLARKRSWPSRGLYGLFVAGMVVPLQLMLLPLLVSLQTLNLSGSIWGLALAYAGITLPMSILFMTSAFGAIPSDLDDAARLDGAGSWTILVRIVLPLARPVLAALTILTGVWIWNDLLVALILASRPEIQTLPVAITSFFGTYSTEWTLAFASVAVSAIPLLGGYLLFTRQFISGLSVGAFKG